MEDPDTTVEDFDPDAAVDVETGKDPSDMTPQERIVAAKHALYESSRLMVGAKAALEYLAELAGVPEDDVRGIALKAEEDELTELEDDDDDDDVDSEAAYEVAASYEEAEARGHDPAADAEGVFQGGDE